FWWLKSIERGALQTTPRSATLHSELFAKVYKLYEGLNLHKTLDLTGFCRIPTFCPSFLPGNVGFKVGFCRIPTFCPSFSAQNVGYEVGFCRTVS
ncbi:MAG: hypothetical protein IKH20_11445, partial [Clostridiales bacterium]|nr:hypothetical protein [Clostridiales bacterium]